MHVLCQDRKSRKNSFTLSENSLNELRFEEKIVPFGTSKIGNTMPDLQGKSFTETILAIQANLTIEIFGDL